MTRLKGRKIVFAALVDGQLDAPIQDDLHGLCGYGLADLLVGGRAGNGDQPCRPWPWYSCAIIGVDGGPPGSDPALGSAGLIGSEQVWKRWAMIVDSRRVKPMVLSGGMRTGLARWWSPLLVATDVDLILHLGTGGSGRSGRSRRCNRQPRSSPGQPAERRRTCPRSSCRRCRSRCRPRRWSRRSGSRRR